MSQRILKLTFLLLLSFNAYAAGDKKEEAVVQKLKKAAEAATKLKKAAEAATKLKRAAEAATKLKKAAEAATKAQIPTKVIRSTIGVLRYMDPLVDIMKGIIILDESKILKDNPAFKSPVFESFVVVNTNLPFCFKLKALLFDTQ